TYVDVVGEVGAQREQQAAFQDSAGDRGVADRTQVDGFLLGEFFLDRRGQCLTGAVPKVGSEFVLGGFEGQVVLGGGDLQNFEAFTDHLGPDAVAGNDGQFHGTRCHTTASNSDVISSHMMRSK